jgi:hypothetical protein
MGLPWRVALRFLFLVIPAKAGIQLLLLDLFFVL